MKLQEVLKYTKVSPGTDQDQLTTEQTAFPSMQQVSHRQLQSRTLEILRPRAPRTKEIRSYEPK